MDAVNKVLELQRYKEIFALLKGIRNGIVYGIKVRFPHALVMTLLFKRGPIKQMIMGILRATYQHARNLGQFTFLYKMGCLLFRRMFDLKTNVPWQTFMSAFVAGKLVFGENNPINMQINMYLLSRIIFGSVRLASEKGYLPSGDTSKGGKNYFPWYAGLMWGIVLTLFEYNRHTLQPSLQNSMTYLYDDSNVWHNLTDFLLWNKLPL